MNKTNKLPEEELNSWRPRRPSAGLKRRIFALSRHSSTRAARWLWGTLAPTMACLVLTLAMLNSSNTAIHQPSETTVVFGNQVNTFSDGDGGQTAQNNVANVTFDWTNHSVFNSSMRFTPTTNSSN